MDDLIARLEKATEGSRELDHAVAEAALAAGGEVRLWGQPPLDPPVKTFQYRDGSKGTAPNYTTSLDAALTLVPEGWGGRIYLSGAVSLWSDGPDLGAVCRALAKNETPREPTKKVVGSSDCGSPALALCIAALKARQAGQ